VKSGGVGADRGEKICSLGCAEHTLSWCRFQQGGPVPVTARLSKRFYDVLGEDIANELVEWFNLVDATYRSDLRELNELNFARFDAKVGQRFAESEASFDRKLVELEARIGKRLVELEARVDHRLVQLEAKIDHRLVQLEAKIEQRALELRQEILGLRADSEVGLERTRADLIRWMFLFWLGSVATSILTRIL
jgi:hypothetical protein